MHSISREDIEGSRITRVDSASEFVDGYTTSMCYFTTDRGLTFTLPQPGTVFAPATIPIDAKELEDVIEEPIYLVKRHWFFGTRFVRQTPKRIDHVKRIKERLIAGIYCPAIDEALGFYPPDSSFILFDDGASVRCVTAAPTGTSAAGLYFLERDDNCVIIDFFDVPLLDA